MKKIFTAVLLVISLLLLSSCTSPQQRPDVPNVQQNIETPPQKVQEEPIVVVDHATENSPLRTDKKFTLGASDIQTQISVYNAMSETYEAVQFEITRCISLSGIELNAGLPAITAEAQDINPGDYAKWTVTVAATQMPKEKYLCELQVYSQTTGDTLLSKQLSVEVI